MQWSFQIKRGALWLLLTWLPCAWQQPWAQQVTVGIAPTPLQAGPYFFDSAEQHRIRVAVLARGLAHPFSLTMLPNGDALISERGGQLRMVRNAAGNGNAQLLPQAIQGLPAATAVRGAGLHDVVLHPQFASNRWVYFTYNTVSSVPPAAGTRPSMTLTVQRGRLEGMTLHEVQVLFQGEAHAGFSASRLAFTPDGLLFIATGSPVGDQPQQLNSVYGKVLRLNADGSIPADNPFVGRSNVRPEIYSFGHRDQLGITVQPGSNVVLAAEHGPNGGDKVNLILPGRNYGWPTYSFGRAYTGARVSAMPVGPDTEQPLLLWVPSIAPTGMTFYDGDRFPAWRGNLFIGSARRGEVLRTGSLERVVFNDKLEELRREALLTELHQRIRDVRQGPDGLLYVITDEDDGALLRISPAQ